MSTVTDPYAENLREQFHGAGEEWCRRLEDVQAYPGAIPETLKVRPQTDGTYIVGDVGDERGHYRITVIVEPVERWDEVTWETLPSLMDNVGPAEVYVSLAGVRAGVLSATRLDWHVDPNSHPRNPIPQENSTIQVRLLVDGQTEPKVYSMPPSGKVMLLSGPLGPAITEILQVFPGTEVIPNV